MKDSIDFFQEKYCDRPKLYVLAGMEELGEKSQEFHRDIGEYIKLGEADLAIFIGEKGRWMAQALLENNVRRAR